MPPTTPMATMAHAHPGTMVLVCGGVSFGVDEGVSVDGEPATATCTQYHKFY